MDAGAWMQYGFASAAFLFGARALYNFYNTPEPEGCSYLPWPGTSITSSSVMSAPLMTSLSAGGHAEGRVSSSSNAAAGGGSSDDGSGSNAVTVEDIVVVDCTHPFLPTLSHHKGSNNPAAVKAADTSTGGCRGGAEECSGGAKERQMIAGAGRGGGGGAAEDCKGLQGSGRGKAEEEEGRGQYVVAGEGGSTLLEGRGAAHRHLGTMRWIGQEERGTGRGCALGSVRESCSNAAGTAKQGSVNMGGW